MKKFLKILKKCPLFFGIEDDNLLRMLNCLGARIIEFQKKEIISQEGEKANQIGILLSGSAQIIQYDFYGNKSLLANINSSDVFNEAFACAGVDALPISVIATEASTAMFVDCAHILHTCSNNCGFHQTLIYNLMKDLALKTILFHQKIEVTSKRTTRDKLLAYLGMEAKKAKSNSFEIPFDRQQLADYLEVERSGLSAEISKMRKEGILNSDKNQFELF